MSEQPATVNVPVGARDRLARLLPDAGLTDPHRELIGEPAEADGPDPTPGPVTRLSGAAFDPGRPGVRVLAALAAVVVVVAAVVAWWSRPRPEPLVPQLAVSARPSPVATVPAELVVAVTGAVRQPGLVHLPPGSRVADAIEAAGGLLPGTDLDYLNLARKVVDGELIAVGIPPPPDQAGAVVGGPGEGKVNLNTATQAQLETLPGVGPALAQRIIDYRTSNGPFGSVSELRQVSGIGEVRFAELSDRVTV